MSETSTTPTAPTAPSMPALVLTPPNEALAIIGLIERAARDPSIDLARMQELIQMREAMRRREAETSWDEAMTQAQGEMRAVSVDSSNPQTHSKYASYHALDRALRPIYVRHGFSLSFNTAPAAKDTDIIVQCRVAKGGCSRDYQVTMPADGKGARGGEVQTRTHATGSAVTYARRYLLMMIFNIAIGLDDDDDGVAAGRTERRPPPPAPNVMHVMQRDTAAMPAAATAPPTTQPPEEGGAVPKPTIEDMARAAARKGDEAFRAFYRLRSAEERYKLSFIGGELRALIINATP